MADSVAGVVLAAGGGTRLRPLTLLRPKVLCPLGDRPLVDHAIDRFAGVTDSVAVNIHAGRELLESHLAGRVHLSFEDDEALGTAGALGHLRDWIARRPVLVVNGDTWCPRNVDALLDGGDSGDGTDGWDGERIRVLVVGTDSFRAGVPVAGALMPWRDVAGIPAEPRGLTPIWLRAAEVGRVEPVRLDDGIPWADCGTPARYLAANLQWSGGKSVIGADAVVDGRIERSVVWPGAVVRRQEHLVDAIRADDRITVLVR
jgi:NDP-sugar pyrophosphorylase family protein